MINALRGTLIVSCQATAEEPLHGSIFMAALARAAAAGGAGGIRANGVEDIVAIREVVSLPIIGILKRKVDGSEVYITPTFEDARAVVQAGADLVALDCTGRPRPDGVSIAALIERIHRELGVPVIADTSCLEEAIEARNGGADIIATTLAGYTAYGRLMLEGPDLDFISELVEHVDLPVIAEGRFHEPWQVSEAFARGAFAVVVGGAITRPQEITRRFVHATPQQNLVR